MHFSPLGVATVRDDWLSWLSPPERPRGIVERWPVDPSHLTRWVFTSSVDVSLSSLRGVNPAPNVLTDAQLSRSNSTAFRGDVEQRTEGDHPEFTFENGLRLRDGLAATAGSDGSRSGLAETDDLIDVRDTLSLKRWGNSTLRWFIPVAFGESYLESEFNRPATRPYHHLEWLPIAGVRLPLTPDFALFAGGGLDWETLVRSGRIADGEPAVAAVLVGGLALKLKRLFANGIVALNAEGSLDVAWRDPLTDMSARTWGWGFSGDALIGLSFGWVEPLQTFGFW